MFQIKNRIVKHTHTKKNNNNSRLQTYQILTNHDQMLILCHSYFITTAKELIIM